MAGIEDGHYEGGSARTQYVTTVMQRQLGKEDTCRGGNDRTVAFSRSVHGCLASYLLASLTPELHPPLLGVSGSTLLSSFLRTVLILPLSLVSAGRSSFLAQLHGRLMGGVQRFEHAPKHVVSFVIKVKE